MNRFREKLFNILHNPSAQNNLARYVSYVLVFLIVTNALCVALETVAWLWVAYKRLFIGFEVLSAAIFTVEYLARLWVCVEQPRFSDPVKGRLRYAFTPLPVLDLLVLCTFLTPFDLRFLRIARIFRLLKVLHMENFDASLRHIAIGLQKRKGLIIVSVTLMVICIYAASAVVYQLEHTVQPTVFTSIPATFWWGIETLTTIGYGDMIPKTPIGRLFSGFICIFGIGIFALPMAIVTAVIIEASAYETEPYLCKNCGQSIESNTDDR